MFAPLRLQRGAIDLAARLPGRTSPYGALVAPAGGQTTDARGDRLVVPPAASQDDLPVSLAPLDPADVPMPLPSGLALVAAADVDFHGASLSIPAEVWPRLAPGQPPPFAINRMDDKATVADTTWTVVNTPPGAGGERSYRVTTSVGHDPTSDTFTLRATLKREPCTEVISVRGSRLV